MSNLEFPKKVLKKRVKNDTCDHNAHKSRQSVVKSVTIKIHKKYYKNNLATFLLTNLLTNINKC